MAKHSKGARAFNRWRESQSEPVSIAAVAEAVGDKGGQLFKWASGERAKLPLPLLLSVSRYTSLTLESLADREQLKLARALVAALGPPPEKREMPAAGSVAGTPEAA